MIMQMYGYVYLTTCLVNNKIYVGQHCSNTFDESYHGSGISFRKALTKYGKQNFKTVLLEAIFTNQADLNSREQYWISYYNANNKTIGYNLDLGGTSLGKHSEQTKQKISKTETGKIVADNTKQKQRAAMLARLQIPEEKAKIISHLGNGMLGKNQTYKQKLAASIANKGKKMSVDTKLKLSSSRKYAGECSAKVCRKPVMCIELNKIFGSITEANIYFGRPKNASNITNALKGYTKTAFSYHWKYN